MQGKKLKNGSKVFQSKNECAVRCNKLNKGGFCYGICSIVKRS